MHYQQRLNKRMSSAAAVISRCMKMPPENRTRASLSTTRGVEDVGLEDEENEPLTDAVMTIMTVGAINLLPTFDVGHSPNSETLGGPDSAACCVIKAQHAYSHEHILL